jgi:osmotically-inducible protein OsmY
METDEILQQDVLQQLKRELSTANFDFTVISNNGVITLMGIVDNYTKKTQAENISSKITGVKSVINKIDVAMNCWEEKKDVEITAEILNAFQWNRNTLNNTIKVMVINGWVTLSGQVEWNYQKEAAKEAITSLIGVKGVSNNIRIQCHSDTQINQENLKYALENNRALNSKDIEIEVSNSKITLKGTVDSWCQKELAGRIAWKAFGVIEVDNELLIEE